MTWNDPGIHIAEVAASACELPQMCESHFVTSGSNVALNSPCDAQSEPRTYDAVRGMAEDIGAKYKAEGERDD